MSKKKNSIWTFFASVKLALFVLFILAIASIIGTVIPQNSPVDVYVKQYGENMARLFQILDIPDMYNSWWFTTMLFLLALNLTVCTIERLPSVWRMVVLDNLKTDLGRLSKMQPNKQLITSKLPEEAAVQVRAGLHDKGWKSTEAARDGGILLFAQKAPWTRLGVYIVHTSILVIFAGAMIGSYFGYKGSVMIPETRSTDTIYEFGTRNPIKLGFEVFCNRFTLSHYPNGAPKEFRSDLVIVDDGGKEVARKSIIVNDPLSYKGHTFYQSSYQSYEKFLITLVNNETKNKELFLIEPGKQVQWDAEKVAFGIINRGMTDTPGKFTYKIWFSGGDTSEPFWIIEGDTTVINESGKAYTFSMKEFYATGLQVTKDPGVWCVYIGCGLMLFGLMIAFFFSHRRVWVYISRENDQTSVRVTGNTNKNKPAFDKNFETVSHTIEEKLT